MSLVQGAIDKRSGAQGSIPIALGRHSFNIWKVLQCMTPQSLKSNMRLRLMHSTTIGHRTSRTSLVLKCGLEAGVLVAGHLPSRIRKPYQSRRMVKEALRKKRASLRSV